LGGPGRWPGRARVLALGCCAGPHGRVIAGNILSEVTALSGRAGPWWVLAGDWQVPSESVARRSRHVRRFEWRVGPMCRADCGQWWPAKLCVQLGRSKSVSAPRGPLRAAMSGVVCRAIARARGFPAGPARAPGRVRGKGGPRARGCGSVRGGLGSASCRPPVLGRLGSSPARSRRPIHRGLLRVGVRVGLLVPKATEGLFKLDAGFAPAARSAVAETGPWGLLASESIQRPVPVQPQVPKPRRCASTPTRLIEKY